MTTRPIAPKFRRQVLDAEVRSDGIILRWNSRYAPNPEDPTQVPEQPESVRVFRSDLGISEGYRAFATRPGGRPDSLVVTGLVGGSKVFFRIEFYSRSGLPELISDPIEIDPAASYQPLRAWLLKPYRVPSAEIAWSPNGREIAVGSIGTLLDATTGAERTVPYRLDSPAWSPDGSRIAFVANPPGGGCYVNYQIWAVEADGSQPRTLSEGPVDSDPAWGDDTTLAFCRGTCDPPNIAQIYALNPDRPGSSRLIVDSSRGKLNPSVRRSDGAIVVELRETASSPGGLFLTNLAGALPRPLVVDDEWTNRAACYSPDGSRILFLSDRSGHPDVWVLGLDDRTLRQINTGARTRRSAISASWSPDGNEIAILEEAEGVSAWRVAIYPAR
jgi:Tol biopolymer transport system component